MIKAVTDFFVEALMPNWIKNRLASFKPVTPQQRWGLAAAAQLTELNGHSNETLNPKPAMLSDEWQSALMTWWEVSNRAEIITMLNELNNSGVESMNARSGYGVAWHFVRLINVARWGYAARYLNEAETWEFIDHAALMLRNHFHAWSELAADYEQNRLEWAQEPDPRLDALTACLLDGSNPRSIWNQIPFQSL